MDDAGSDRPAAEEPTPRRALRPHAVSTANARDVSDQRKAVDKNIRCFAQVAAVCREANGLDRGTTRWNSVSKYEHFCQDCVLWFGSGEGRRVWQEQQKHGKCSKDGRTCSSNYTASGFLALLILYKVCIIFLRRQKSSTCNWISPMMLKFAEPL